MTHPSPVSALTRDFRANAITPATFHHRDHVQVAYELLNAHDFADATAIYAKGLRLIATKAGVPQKFNTTITFAFMSLIAERMSQTEGSDFADLLAAHPDLLSKDLLSHWYAPEQLQSDLARKIFIMPRHPGAAG